MFRSSMCCSAFSSTARKTRANPFSYSDKCNWTGYFYMHYTAQETNNFSSTSSNGFKSILLKNTNCQDQDSNPHSADQITTNTIIIRHAVVQTIKYKLTPILVSPIKLIISTTLSLRFIYRFSEGVKNYNSVNTARLKLWIGQRNNYQSKT